MSLQNVVEDVKTRVGSLTAQGQKVAQISLDTIKQANGIVVDKFNELVKTETVVAKDLLETAKLGLDKAKTDGIKAVASAPISYLPPADKFKSAFSDTVTIISSTGDALYQTFKSGIGSIQSEFKPEVKVAKPVKAAAKKARAAAKKAAAAAAE
jgi:hypothetical protein